MSLSDKIKKINAEIDKLRRDLGSKPLKPFKEGDLERAKLTLQGLRAEIREMGSDLDYVSRSFKDSVNELSRQNTYLNDAKKSLSSISDISRKIVDYRKGDSSLTEKQLRNLQRQAKIKFDSLKNDLRSGQLSKVNTQEVKNALDQQQKFDEEVQRTITHQQQVNKEIGLLGQGIGGVSKALEKMGFGDLSQPLQDAIDKTKNARLQQKLNNDELSTTQSKIDKISKKEGLVLSKKQMQAGFGGKELQDLAKKEQSLISQNKELGRQTSKYKNIGNALRDQLTSFNAVDFVLGSLVKAFSTSQNAIGGLAKGLGMSANEAASMRQDFGDIAQNSNSINVNTMSLQQSQLAVGQALSSNAQLNSADLETMTDIVAKTGLQHSELVGIEKLSLSQGKSLDKNLKSTLGGAQAFAAQNKLVVSNNAILKEVNNASASLKLNLGGSTEALGKAVVQAKKFGINLQQAESIASGLLDFESSIQNELEAELLTGKNLNLERARGLALNGKATEAAAEVLSQVGSTTEFMNMNVIAQEKMAAAVNMTREELSASLIDREAMAKMSEVEGKTALERYNNLLAQGKTQAEIVDMIGQENYERLDGQSSQEKFNASVERLKDIFVQVMDTLNPIFEVLSSIAEVIIPAIGFVLSPLIEGFSLIGSLVSSFVQGLKDGKAPAIALAVVLGTMAAPIIGAAIAAIFKSFGMIPFGLGIPLAGIAVAGLFSQLSKAKSVKDAAIDPKGGLIVSGPKGTYQGDPQDTVVMGTGIGKGKGASQQGGGGGGTSVSMAQTNALLQQLINVVQAGGTVTLDGQKVGEALKLGSFQTQ